MMNYNLLICISSKEWVAIDVDSTGKCDRISFDGNESLTVESNEMLLHFCTQICNYYNIDSFKDIDLNIKIVLISEYSNLIADMFSKMKDVNRINVISAENIIPIYILKNCNLKPGSKMDIKCLGDILSIKVDNNLMISFVNDSMGNEIIIEPESFSYLFRFDCKNLISNEFEIKNLEDKWKKKTKEKQTEIDELKKNYLDLKKQYDNLEQMYQELQNEVNKQKIDEMRTIVRFSDDYLKKSNSESSKVFFYNRYYEQKKFSCKLLKSDGDIVRQGTSLIEIDEMVRSSLSLGEWRENGNKCFIKAITDGRIFYLIKNGDVVKDNDAVAILTDSTDNRIGVMNWYKKMK